MVNQLGIVTPFFATPENRRTTYFMDTIDSVLAQDTDFTWAIVDDGSTDPLAKDFLESIDDPRVLILYRERHSMDLHTASNALNYGLNYLLGQCKHFTYVHSDDILLPDSLSLRLARILEGFDMVYGKLVALTGGNLVSKNYAKIENKEDPALMVAGFPHHASMWTARMMETMMEARQYELFDPEICFGEDLDVTLHARHFIEEGMKLGFVDQYVYVWVDSLMNITSQGWGIKNHRQKIYEKNGYNLPPDKKFENESFWRKNMRRPLYFLPGWIKTPLKPVKEMVRKLSGDRVYRKADDWIELDYINPFWFREQATPSKAPVMEIEPAIAKQ